MTRERERRKTRTTGAGEPSGRTLMPRSDHAAASFTLINGSACNKEDRVDNAEGVLRRAPLFDALDDDGARTLRRQMAEVKLSRGEHLFNEGEDGDALYVVLEGKMKLTRAASDGRENLLSVIGP